MRRRKFMIAMGGIVTLAGCSSDGESEPATTTTGGSQTTKESQENTETATETQEETETTEKEPTFELESIEIPEEAEINEEWSWSMTVVNSGNADGTFTTEVYAKTADTEFRSLGEVSLEIPAGESKTYEAETSKVPYLTRATYRFEAFDEIREVKIVSRSLAFGESYENPNGIVLIAHDIDLKDSYTYEGYDGSQMVEEASSGKQWAFLNFEATNESGSSEFLPFDTDINLIYENSQYDSQYINKQDGKYEGGEVQDGITREGWICYEIPSDISTDDLTVAHSGEDFTGEWSVRWRSG